MLGFAHYGLIESKPGSEKYHSSRLRVGILDIKDFL
jgi:hypothetical protein